MREPGGVAFRGVAEATDELCTTLKGNRQSDIQTSLELAPHDGPNIVLYTSQPRVPLRNWKPLPGTMGLLLGDDPMLLNVAMATVVTLSTHVTLFWVLRRRERLLRLSRQYEACTLFKPSIYSD